MPTKFDGKFTIKQVMNFTKQSTQYKNRFKYRIRDKIKGIKVQKITRFEKDRENAPLIKYRIISSSKPHYPPYAKKPKSGKYAGRVLIKRINHEYEITFEAASLSINDTRWKIRLGSGKRWNPKPPQNKIQQIYKETRKRWSNEKIKKHRKRKGLFLDVGDYNSRVNGINADWIFNFSYVFWKNGHQFGRNYFGNKKPSIKNPQMIIAFPKHIINFFEVLMNKGVLTT